MKKHLTTLLSLLLSTLSLFAGDPQTVVVVADCGAAVEIKAESKTGYKFVEWAEDHNTNPTRTIQPTEDATYTAVFEIMQYDIRFVDYDGTILQQSMVDYNVKPTYTKPQPSRAPTAEWTYTFIGWSPTIVEATQDQIYVAQYDSVKNEYTVTFQNSNGAVLQSSKWEYGETPVYKDGKEVPTYPTTPQPGHSYVFKGWSPSVDKVTGDVTYTAIYDEIIETHTVTLDDDPDGCGKELKGAGTFEYGTNVTVTAIPTDCYEFVGWRNKGEEAIISTSANYTFVLTEDVELIAVFKKSQYTITVKTADSDMGVVSEEIQ